jgi:hypothetical protein
MFLHCMYVGFLAPLVPAYLLYLVFRRVNGNMMVVLVGDACGSGGFGCRDCVAAEFIDIGERWVNVGSGGRVEERKKLMGREDNLSSSLNVVVCPFWAEPE